MLGKISVNIKVKQTLWSKILFKLLVYLIRFKVVSVERLAPVVNLSLQKGAFKFKVNNSKWKPLEMPVLALEE